MEREIVISLQKDIEYSIMRLALTKGNKAIPTAVSPILYAATKAYIHLRELGIIIDDPNPVELGEANDVDFIINLAFKEWNGKDEII